MPWYGWTIGYLTIHVMKDIWAVLGYYEYVSMNTHRQFSFL